jgi:hypothetical protein
MQCVEIEMSAQSRWTFFGVVTPERVPVDWDIPLAGKARSLGWMFEFRVMIWKSQIIVDINVLDGTPDIFSLRNIAVTLAENLTDLIGYKEACYFNVEIISAINRDTDDWQVFGIDIPALLESRRESPKIIDSNLIRQVAKNHAAQIALSDFGSAMRFPKGTGFYCYRAIEAMMQSMKDSDQVKDGIAWDFLRSHLNVTREAIDEVKAHADLPRHGKPSGMTDAERVTVFRITDEILRRFLIFITGEGLRQPLSLDEFPVVSP